MLRAAIEKITGEDRRRLEIETGVMEFHLIQTQSAANVVDFLLARNAYYASADAAQRRGLLDRMEAICRDELANAAAAIPLLQADPRLGWHGEAYGYMIAPEFVEQKLTGLRDILDRRIPDERAKL
jgi:hypothetical protein